MEIENLLAFMESIYKNGHKFFFPDPNTHMDKHCLSFPHPACWSRWPFIFWTKINLNGHKIASFSREEGKELEFNEEP